MRSRSRAVLFSLLIATLVMLSQVLKWLGVGATYLRSSRPACTASSARRKFEPAIHSPPSPAGTSTFEIRRCWARHR